jgi:hypothetical protein
MVQNELGYGQVSKSVTGVTGITFPPLACCGVPDVPWSPGLLSSCELIVDGQLLSIAAENLVSYRWLPHRVERRQMFRGLRIRTRTFMPAGSRAVAEAIEITNLAAAPRELALGFDMQAAVTRKSTAWMSGTPGEGGNEAIWQPGDGAVVFRARNSRAASAQGVWPAAKVIRGGHILEYRIRLLAGETRRFQYVNAMAEGP